MRMRLLSHLLFVVTAMTCVGCEDDPAEPLPPVHTVATVTVSPDTVTMTAIGAVKQFTAVARDANGDVVVNARFTWSSTNPGAARVNSIGLVTAVGPGQADIVATSQGVMDAASVDVAIASR